MIHFLLATALMISHAEARLRYFSSGLKPYGEIKSTELTDLVRLSGSKGETLNFTLKLETSDCVSLSAATELKTELAFHKIEPFITLRPSYKGAPVGTHWDPVIPATRFCEENPWILGEFTIPSTAAAGLYHGEIKTSGGEALPIEIKVWNIQFPRKPALPLYSELTTWYLLLGHYGKWHEGEPALARQYAESMEAHRVFPVKNWIRIPEIRNDRINLRDPSAEGQDDSYVSAVARNSNPFAYLTTPFAFPLKVGPESERYLKLLHDAFSREGLLSRSLIYLWDEPGKDEQGLMRKISAMVKKHAPGFRRLVTTPFRTDLRDSVDVFAPVFDQYDTAGFPTPAQYRELQSRGKEVWLYASCMSHGCGNNIDSGTPDWVIDRPGAYVRSQAWIAHRYKLDGLLYYAVANGYRNFAQGADPWKDLWEFSGNGDGTLFYPGRPGLKGLTAHAPVASLRLKIWRQSSFDAEYLRAMGALGEKPEWWAKAVTSVARSTRDWDRNESSYSLLREKIGNHLDRNQKP